MIFLSLYRQRLFDYMACLILYEHCIEVTAQLCMLLCCKTVTLGLDVQNPGLVVY